MPTVSAAINLFKSFVNKPRTALPWLKKRPNLYDCAAGYTYVSGLIAKRPNIVWVHEIVDVCKANGTWVQYKKGLEKKSWPKPGDALIFDWHGTHTRTDHVAMVISASSTHITAVGADQGHNRLVTFLNEPNYWPITGWGTPVKYDDVESAPVAPVVPVVAPVKPVFKPIKVGSKGEAVKTVQKAVGAGVDGIFGPLTEKAVKAWQLKNNLAASGVIDEGSWNKIVGK